MHFVDAIDKCKRVDTSSSPLHRMHPKAQRFDGCTMLIDPRNDVNIIAGALRCERHRNAMPHEIPILSYEIDQHRLRAKQIRPWALSHALSCGNRRPLLKIQRNTIVNWLV